MNSKAVVILVVLFLVWIFLRKGVNSAEGKKDNSSATKGGGGSAANGNTFIEPTVEVSNVKPIIKVQTKGGSAPIKEMTKTVRANV